MNPPRRRNSHSKRQGRGRSRRQAQDRAVKGGPAFWGDHSSLPEAVDRVTITPQPPAVVRSLGRPPLAGHDAVAGHYFDAVYERAVALATALAAAGGLLEPEHDEDER